MTAAPPKFPLPFADRQPQFVPRSIDPKVPFSYYPGEGPTRQAGHATLWRCLRLSMWIAACALATVPYWMTR